MISWNKKNLQKWEQDEPHGDMATISPVLYANMTHPELKAQYPGTSLRGKLLTQTLTGLKGKLITQTGWKGSLFLKKKMVFNFLKKILDFF